MFRSPDLMPYIVLAVLILGLVAAIASPDGMTQCREFRSHAACLRSLHP